MLLDLSTLRCADKVHTGSGVPLIVNKLSYSLGTDVADIVAYRATPESAVLTSDGRGYDAGVWHEGDDGTGPSVYVERWTGLGLDFHGWIHPASRRIVQAG